MQEAEWRKEKEEKKLELENISSRLETVTMEKTRVELLHSEQEDKCRELREEVGRLHGELGEHKSRCVYVP